MTGLWLVWATEQADRLMAGGDIKMQDGMILNTKDLPTPTDASSDQGYIAVQFKPVAGRKPVSVFLMQHALGWRVTQPGDQFTVRGMV